MSLTAQKTIVSHYNTPVLSHRNGLWVFCFVNDTVFLVRSDSTTIESYHDGVFTGSLTVPLRTGWLSGIAASAAHNCLYVGASQSTQLHRVDLASAIRMVWYMTKWPA